MILTVTLNPALDLTWQVHQIRLGRSHRVEKAAERAGGKGINVARILHNEGIPVMAVTTCGGMTGRIFRADIERSGVPHVLIDVAASTRRSAAIVSRTDGDTAIFNERGEPLSDDEVDRVCDSVIRRADADTVCVVSGSLPPSFSELRFASLLQDIRRSGALLIVDTSGSALEVAARAGAHLLKPNREELAEVTGTTDPVAGARALISQGAKLVMVSLGGDGLLLVPASGAVLHARSVHPVRGNPTGAVMRWSRQRPPHLRRMSDLSTTESTLRLRAKRSPVPALHGLPARYSCHWPVRSPPAWSIRRLT